MELFILISCVLLLVLNMILIGLHVRSRKNNTAQEVSRSISDLEKVIRDESRYNRENDENRSRKDREELASTLNPFPLPESGAFNKHASRPSTNALHSAKVLK